MGALFGSLGRLLFTTLAGYGGWRVVESAVDGPDVAISTSGPVSTFADKLGINKIFLYLALVVAAIIALRYFFKSKSL